MPAGAVKHRRRLRRTRGARRLAPLALASGLLTLAWGTPARGQGVDQTCLLSLTQLDPGTVNVLFPDQSASYWSGGFAYVPGVRIRIAGEFPFARYMSWTAYDTALRPVDGLNDVHIRPASGSANPFLPGADRSARPRRYTVFVEFGPKPGDPAPNTIYTGGPENPASVITYRVYIPNEGLDATGGVGLPRVTVEPQSGNAAALSGADCRRVAKPSFAALNDLYAGQTPPPQLDGLLAAGRPKPLWHKFVNLPIAVADSVFSTEDTEPARDALDRLPLEELGGQGGFLSNPDNAYVYAPISRAWGQVLVLRGKAPTFPHTRDWEPRMQRGQLRYWSLCQNEPQSQRFIACLADDQTVLNRHRRYTTVISTAAQRPANARPACGVNWIPWGPSSRGVLILRNMLPVPTFERAIQFATYGHERETMGGYLPTGHYLPDRGRFEKRGC